MLRNIFFTAIVFLLSGCFGHTLVTYPGVQKEKSAKVMFEFVKEGDQANEYGIFGEVSIKKGNACEGKWNMLNENRVQMLMYLPAEEPISTKVFLGLNTSGAMGMVISKCNLIATYKFKEGKSYKIKSIMGNDIFRFSCYQTINEVEFIDDIDSVISNASASSMARYFIKNEISSEKNVTLQSCN